MGYYLRSHERRTSNGLHPGINKSGGTPRLDVERRPQPHAMLGKQRAEGLRRVESALRAQILEPACPDSNMIYFLTQNTLEDGDGLHITNLAQAPTHARPRPEER